MIFSFLTLFFVCSAALHAHVYDFSRDYTAQQEPLDVFNFLVFDAPQLVRDGTVILNNPLLSAASPLDKMAYKLEGERVLAAYLCARKRMHPESLLTIALDTCGVQQELVFDDAELCMQNYALGEISDPLTLRSLDTFCFHQNTRDDRIQDALLINPVFESNNVKPRAVVTGCVGFLGSALVKRLLQKGFQVIGLDNGVCGKMNNIADIKDNSDFYYCAHDITLPFNIEGPVDMILHFASIPSPPMYYKMPLETLNAGLKGTLYTLDLAVAKNARYLFASTSEVYGNALVNPQPETYAGNVDPLGIRSQYDESKRGAETLISLYFQKYGIDVRIARIFNTYGPGMRLSDGRVITNFLGALLHDNPLVIHGSGEQTRSFAYVTDTVDGIMKLLENNKLTQSCEIQERVFNIGTPHEFTINELAEIVQELGKEKFRKEFPIHHIARFDKTDPDVRRPDITKAQKVLGWSPQVKLIDGLEKTLKYFMQESV